MGRLLDPPRHIEERTDAGVDADYKKLRNQVFLGAFIGYAAFYIVRKNFSMAIPMPSRSDSVRVNWARCWP